MADKSISELNAATAVGSSDLFVLQQGGTAKKLTGQILENWLVALADGHGGIQTITKTGTSGLVDTYTITLADETTMTFTVTNGKSINSISKTSTSGLVDTYTITYNNGTTSTFTVRNGEKGDTGDAWYVHIKYASVQPTSDSDMGSVPDKWIGIYSGTSETAPAHYTSYSWYQYKGEKGNTGDAAEIESTAIEYQVGTSGTVVPSGTWTTTIPTVPQGQYLWTRTTITFNSGSPIISYSVSRTGLDGSGSVSSVNNESPDSNGNVSLNAEHIPVDGNTSVQAELDDINDSISEQSSQIVSLQTLLGNILPQAWGTKSSYAVGEVCIRDDKIMQATQVASGVTWESAKWTQVRINNVAVLSYSEV